MRLTVLGSSGTFPGPDSPCSSYLVEADGFRLLLDAGNGALGALQRHGGLLDVDAIVISHLHGDHWLDLVPYAYARRYHPAGRGPQVPLHGPPGTLDLLRAVGASTAEEVYDVRRLEPGTCGIGPFTVTFGRTNHPVETYASRIEAGGRTLSYSADTAECDTVVELARDADTFLCEASHLDGGSNPPGLHLTGGQAGGHARRAGAGRLLLTHLVPWNDPARTLEGAAATYDGPTELARSGAGYEI